MKGLVNGSANNSANYIKKLPVPKFSDKALSRALILFKKIQADNKSNNEEIDDFVNKYLITNQDS